MPKTICAEDIDKIEEILLEHQGIKAMDLCKEIGKKSNDSAWLLTSLTHFLPIYDETIPVRGSRVIRVYINEGMVDSFKKRREEAVASGLLPRRGDGLDSTMGVS